MSASNSIISEFETCCNTSFKDIPYGIVVSVKACRAGGPGSIPEVGNLNFFSFQKLCLGRKCSTHQNFCSKSFVALK